MRTTLPFLLVIAALASAVKPSFAATGAMRTPAAIDHAGLATFLQGARYARENRISGPAESELHRDRAQSVPHWAGSYSLGGQVFPFIMLGGKPSVGGTTHVKTSILPISLVFDEFVDASGQNITVDVTPDLEPVIASPDFLRAPYGTGDTQFSDAIQRAEFWNVMGADWHTLLDPPRLLKPLILEVPVGVAQLFQSTTTGAFVALLDQKFFGSQLNTIVQLADLHPTELAILLTPNVFLSDGNPQDGLVLGFHIAFDARNPDATGADPATARFVQTLAWASWIDPGLFSGLSDVTALSHEIAEVFDDPFIDNATERWAFPGSNGAVCQSNLETGDPVEVLANPAFPVTLHGYTYHPQTEALLQWFSQEVPSSAFDHAYSYPDTTALPTPSQTCSPDAGL
jgi:hypothetical protein